MQNKEYTEALQATIQWMEGEKTAKGEQLKERFQGTYESLKPMNLLKSTMKEVVSTSTSLDDLIGPMIGLIAGNLAKKVVMGKSENPNRQAIAAALQVGITHVIVQHPEELKSLGKMAWQLLFGKRNKKADK